jgi:large conductance mechanosensitive channel
VIDEFKKFLLRGNIVDLAVAVVIGAAFKGVIDAFTAGVVSPLVGLIAGQNFDTLTITLVDPNTATGDPGVVLAYGAVITQIINFVIVAAVLFFLVVKPLNVIAERRKRGEEPEDVPPSEQELLVEIRDLLKAQAQ